MSNDKEKDNMSGGMLIVICISGILAYLILVMPLRIIFKHRDNSILYTIMPFGNILSGPAIGSLIMYGLATCSWSVIAVNYFNTNPKYEGSCAPEIYVALSIFGSAATLLSVWLARKDVQDSMECQSY